MLLAAAHAFGCGSAGDDAEPLDQAEQAAFDRGSAVPCTSEWMTTEPGVRLSGYAIAEGYAGFSYQAAACWQRQINIRVASSNPKRVIAVLALTNHGDAYGLKLYRKVNATFRFGFRATASKLHALDGPRTRYDRKTSATAVRRYPYDWMELSLPPDKYVRHADLAMPGFVAGKSYYAVDTAELSEVSFRAGGSGAVATVPWLRPIVNRHGDGTSPRLPFTAGATESFTLIRSSNLGALQDRRLGASPRVAERIVQVPFRGWAIEGKNLTAWQYRRLARAIVPGYDAVILRTSTPDSWVASIFAQEGLRVYHYQFWGAVRLLAGDELPEGVDPSWILRQTTHGQAAARYSAPEPAGNWQLLDVRLPAVRDYFVARAAQLVADGWDGIFLDGSPLWADAGGKVGGNGGDRKVDYPALMSWAAARLLVLQEMKATMRAADANSRIGVLAPERVFDHIHAADYAVREGLFFGWVDPDDLADNPLQRMARHSLAFHNDWDAHQRPLLRTSLAAGSKSANPLLVGSAQGWLTSASEASYVDFGDFLPSYTGTMADILGDVGAYMDDTLITAVTPSEAQITSLGPSRIKVDRAATLAFDQKVALLNKSSGNYAGFSASHALQAGVTYVVAERRGQQQWRWSREGFAWYNGNTYLTGDMRLSESPVRIGNAAQFVGIAYASRWLELRSAVAPATVLVDGFPVSFEHDGDTTRFQVVQSGVVEIHVEPAF